jgi:uncharacterized OB-fold protein
MPNPIPVADELSKPFWDAANAGKLVIQHCTACNAIQHPPRPRCRDCGSDQLEWKDTNGRGHISTCAVVDDGRIGAMQPEQPFNLAVITLDEDPRVNYYSNLPGVPVRNAPIGAAVEVIFKDVSPEQKIPEWRVIA